MHSKAYLFPSINNLIIIRRNHGNDGSSDRLPAFIHVGWENLTAGHVTSLALSGAVKARTACDREILFFFFDLFDDFTSIML